MKKKNIRPSANKFISNYLQDDHYKQRIIPESKNVIKADAFDREDYGELLKEMRELSLAEDKISTVVATGAPVMADSFWSCLKADPKLKSEEDIRPSHLVNRVVIDELMELKEWEELRTYSTSDIVASGLACIALEPELEILFDKLKEESKLAKELEEQLQQMSGIAGELASAEELAAAALEEEDNEEEAEDYQRQVEKIREQMDKLRQKIQDKADQFDEQIQGKGKEIREYARKALKDAKDKAETLDSLSSSWGLDPGQLYALPAQRRIELAQKFNNDKFKRIAKLIGPMSRVALAEQKKKIVHARDEIYDLELGDNIANVLPTELLYMADEDTALLFFKKLVERELIVYKLRGTEKVAKGGIIFAEDGSGSMGGDPEIWAKAVGLALYRIAQFQKREFYGIHFGSPGEIMTFDFHSDTNTGVDIELYGKPYRVDASSVGHYDNIDGLIRFAECFFGSGPLRIDQRVITPQGWKPIGEIKVDDWVYGPDGLPTLVTGVYPQGILDDIYKVTFRDGAEVICDGGHIWTVKTRYSNVYKNITLNEIISSGLRYEHKNGSQFKFSIPMSSPIELEKKEYILSPYLLGYMLGDGTLAGDEHSPSIGSAEEEFPWIEELPEGMTVAVWNEPTEDRCGQYGLKGYAKEGRIRGWENPVIDGLTHYGLLGKRGADKFIPNEYLWGSIQQRFDLLSGLLDSDGHARKEGGFYFSNISENLARGVVHLTQSLGGVASINISEKVRDNEQPIWRVHGRLPEIIEAPFRLTRKIASYRKALNIYTRSIVSIETVTPAEAVCIKVENPNGLFLTEGFVVTHNTDFVTPLSKVLDILQKQYAEEGKVKADCVIVTDGICGVPNDWLKEFQSEKERLGFKVWGVLLGYGTNRDTEPLSTICDGRVLLLKDLLHDGARSIFGGV